MHPHVLALIKQAIDLPNGPKKLPPLLEARASAQGDDEALFEVHYNLCHAYTFCGQPENALAAFSWCLDKLDTEPQRFGINTPNILWHYKFVLEGLPQFADLTVEQIDDSLLDYKQRLVKAGFSTRNYHYMKAQIDLALGRLQSALDNRGAYIRMDRDNQSDCHACEVNFSAQLAFDCRNWSDCVSMAQPILSNRSTCATVPGRSLGFLALAYLRMEDREQAKRCVDWGVGITRTNPTYLLASASYIQAHTRLYNYPEALRLVSQRIPWAMESFSATRRLCFFVSAAHLVSRMIREEGDFKVALSIPLEGLASNEASAFLAWCEFQNTQLSSALDDRNGNTYWTDYVRKTWEW